MTTRHCCSGALRAPSENAAVPARRYSPIRGFHADRTPRRARHHRHPGRPAFARAFARQTKSPRHRLREQSQTIDSRLGHVRPLVPNNPVLIPSQTTSRSWALGDIRYGNPDGTNIDYLISQREGSLGPYLKTHQVFKCPSDKSLSKLDDGKSYSRVRGFTALSTPFWLCIGALNGGAMLHLPRYRTQFWLFPSAPI